MPYVVDSQYYDYETGRTRYAVLCTETRCYYFAANYGKRAAQALANKMNQKLKESNQ